MSAVLLTFVLTCFFSGATLAFEQSQFFTYAPGKRLHYRTIGEGPRKIVMLHGIGASSRTWDNLLQHWQPPSGHQLILFDLIGFGFSSKHPGEDHSMQANARALNRFLDQQGLNEYLLIGHSFGGGVALMTALDRQQQNKPLPSRLVLLDPAVYESEFPLFVAALRVPIANRLLLATMNPETLAAYTLGQLFHDRKKISSTIIQRYAFFMALPGHDDALIETALQIVPKNIDEYLVRYPGFDTPVLVIWGEQDPAIDRSYGERLVSELPNAKLRIIPDCGHLPQTECPEATATHISDFIRSE